MVAKTFEELRQAYKELLADNQQLIADNRKLRQEVTELKQLNDGYVKIIAKNQETNNKLMASVQKQTGGDYIKRADAIEAVCRTRCGDKAKGCPAHSCLVIEEFDALPSADAAPTVIRAKTFMCKEDFDKWAEDIKKQNKSIVCIQCDAEVVSADAEPKWNCTANFVAEQLDRLRNMTDEEKWEFFKRFFEMKGGAK